MRPPTKRNRIADQLRLKIRSGAYIPAERLPTEPLLAREFGVARETLRGALQLLDREGLIQRIPGEGTYITGKSARVLTNRDLYHLIPCSDYFIHSDYQTRVRTSEMLSGCLSEAVRMNAHVITLPVSPTNREEEIDWRSLERLPEGARIVFFGRWFQNIFPLLQRKRCLVVNIHDMVYNNPEIRKYTDSWVRIRADVAEAAADFVKRAFRRGCRRIAVAASFLEDEFCPIKAGYLEGLRRCFGEAVTPICLDLGGVLEPELAFRPRLRALHEKFRFDALYFGLHDHFPVDYRLSFHANLGLPDDLFLVTHAQYDFNRNCRPRIPYVTFDWKNMGETATRFLFSETYEPVEFTFKGEFHFINEDGKEIEK